MHSRAAFLGENYECSHWASGVGLDILKIYLHAKILLLTSILMDGPTSYLKRPYIPYIVPFALFAIFTYIGRLETGNLKIGENSE